MTDIPPAPGMQNNSNHSNHNHIQRPVHPDQGNKPLEIKVESREHELHHKPEHEEHAPHEHEQIAHEKVLHKHQHRFHISEKFLRITTIVALVAWFLIAILLSVAMDENPFYVFLGLAPVIFTIVVTYILIDQYHVENGFLMVFPTIFSGIFMVLGAAGLLGGLDWQLLTVVNFICGIFFEAVLIMQHSFIHLTFKKDEEPVYEEKKEVIIGDNLLKIEIVGPHDDAAPVPQKAFSVPLNSDEDVKKFVANIEDKAKAINAVIGRVYSVRHGGVETMRKKIRIDPEHYNGFNELKDKRAAKRKTAAIKLLNKILDTLKQLKEAEEDVFSKSDVSCIVNLNREPAGTDKILDVLAKNDSDPVKTYYDGAVQFCQEAVKILKAEEKTAKASEKAKAAEKKAADKKEAETKETVQQLVLSPEGEKDEKSAAGPKGRIVLKKDQLKRLAHKKQMKKDIQQMKLR